MYNRFVAVALAASFLAACGGSEDSASDSSSGRVKNAAIGTSTTVKMRSGKLKSTTTVATPPPTTLVVAIATTAPPTTTENPTTTAAPSPRSTVAPNPAWMARSVTVDQILAMTRTAVPRCADSRSLSASGNPAQPNVVRWSPYSSILVRPEDPRTYPMIEVSNDRRTWHTAPYIQDSHTSATVLNPYGVALDETYYARVTLIVSELRCLTATSIIVFVRSR